MLNRCRVERRADSFQDRLTFIARVVEDADLDELVGGEVDVDLLQHGRREPLMTDAHHRMEVMRPGAKLASLDR